MEHTTKFTLAVYFILSSLIEKEEHCALNNVKKIRRDEEKGRESVHKKNEKINGKMYGQSFYFTSIVLIFVVVLHESGNSHMFRKL